MNLAERMAMEEQCNVPRPEKKFRKNENKRLSNSHPRVRIKVTKNKSQKHGG